MGNHLHLIIKTTKPNLAAGMRIVQGGYARQFNRRHGRTGHLFGDRYGSVTIKGDEHFRIAARYVARNPLEAGLAKKLGEWPWESNADRPTAIARKVVDRPELLRLFGLEGADPDERERQYRSFITQPLPP